MSVIGCPHWVRSGHIPTATAKADIDLLARSRSRRSNESPLFVSLKREFFKHRPEIFRKNCEARRDRGRIGDRRRRRKGRVRGLFRLVPRQKSRDPTGWLGRQDSNLGMAESKSDYFINAISAHSEKPGNFGLFRINRLPASSEWRPAPNGRQNRTRVAEFDRICGSPEGTLA